MSNESKVGIRLLTLSDCDYCMWLKSELDATGITYTNIDANIFSEFADAIEDKYKCEAYPMVFIEYSNKVIALVPETELPTSELLRTFDSIPELVKMIKTYI